MALDVIHFLEVNKIPYITHGVNVKKGEININCPFCAQTSSPDPSFHLGIDPERLWFSCWRNRKSHRGRSLHRLIMILLSCNYSKACEVLGQQPIWVDAAKFDGLTFDELPSTPPTPLEYPPEFRLFDGMYWCQRFVDYLVEDRGFPLSSVYRVAQRYQLRATIQGTYKDRVIIPNTINGRLVNWTARSVYPGAELRYLTLSDFQGALVNIKQCVFNSDDLQRGGSVLLVVEGPFDAIKVDFYGAPVGVRATCLFNKKATLTQLGYLGELSNVFTKIVPMFDRGEEIDQRDLLDQLSWLPSESLGEWLCPKHVKDPGELTPNDVRHLCQQLTERLL